MSTGRISGRSSAMMDRTLPKVDKAGFKGARVPNKYMNTIRRGKYGCVMLCACINVCVHSDREREREYYRLLDILHVILIHVYTYIIRSLLFSFLFATDSAAPRLGLCWIRSMEESTRQEALRV